MPIVAREDLTIMYPYRQAWYSASVQLNWAARLTALRPLHGQTTALARLSSPDVGGVFVVRDTKGGMDGK